MTHAPVDDAAFESCGDMLSRVVGALCEANVSSLERPQTGRTLPSREALSTVVNELRSALFPFHFGAPDVSRAGLSYFVGRTLDSALRSLERQVYYGLVFECGHGGLPCSSCASRASEVLTAFAERLPQLRSLLGTDALAAYEGDPAAHSPDEAVFCYPGLTAILHHRLAHELFSMGVPLIPRIISELAHASTGIDIHPGAKIGGRFFIDHGTGVVVGETCVIGNRVRLYQGVTLGAKSFPKDENGAYLKGAPRHPIVEDDVVIYAGATVLGRITLGRGATIGGNVWLTESVEPGARITQAQSRRQWFDGGAGI
ncbi:MAG TPA: serine O-acetyltransferase EpsC [Polyangiaceae bacterium]|nr:serine O-acetyltransferase EpsC [Polyangiaceae bacterium]